MSDYVFKVWDLKQAIAGFDEQAPIEFWAETESEAIPPQQLFLHTTDQEKVNNKNAKVSVIFTYNKEK